MLDEPQKIDQNEAPFPQDFDCYLMGICVLNANEEMINIGLKETMLFFLSRSFVS